MIKVVKLLVSLIAIAIIGYSVSHWLKSNPDIINRGRELFKSGSETSSNLINLQSKMSLLDDDLKNIKSALDKGDFSNVSVFFKKYLADFSEFRKSYEASKTSLSDSENKILSAKEAINFEEFIALKNKIGSNKDLEASFTEITNSITKYISGLKVSN